MAEIEPRLISKIDVRGPAPDRHEVMAQTIRAFLAWLVTDKGLRLCEAFKPQCDWYSPVGVSHTRLAHQLLCDASIDRTKRERRA